MSSGVPLPPADADRGLGLCGMLYVCGDRAGDGGEFWRERPTDAGLAAPESDLAAGDLVVEGGVLRAESRGASRTDLGVPDLQTEKQCN